MKQFYRNKGLMALAPTAILDAILMNINLIMTIFE